MKKIAKTASTLLIAVMLFCFVGCPNASTPEPETPNTSDTPNTPNTSDTPNTPSSPASPAVTVSSGIYTESGVFYINVQADKSPASGNGAW